MIGNYGISTETSALAGVLVSGVLDPLLKDVASMDIQKLYFDRNPLLKDVRELGDVNWNVESRRATFTVEVSGPGSFAGLNENEAMPRPSAGEFVQGEFGVKYFYSTFAITGPAFARGTNAKSLKHIVKHNMKGIGEAAEFHMERMLTGDGAGVLCDVDSYAVGTPTTGTVTIDQAGNNGIPHIRFVRNNSNIAWGSVANNVLTKTGSGVVTSKSRAGTTFKIIIRSGIAPAHDDVVVMGDDQIDSYGKEMYGLQNFINPTPNTLHGIDGAKYEEWNAQTYDCNGTLPSSELFTRICNDYEDVTDQMPKAMLFSPAALLAYQESLMPDVRFQPGVLKGGASGLQFVHPASGDIIPLKRVRSFPDNLGVAWDPAVIGYSWLVPFGWRSWDDGRIMRPAPNGIDAAYAYYQAYGNCGCKNRQKLMGIMDIGLLP